MDIPEGTFSFRHPVEVRFKDVDIGGHAHHSLALVYFEEARAAYWREVVGREGLDEVDYILVEAQVRYHNRVLWPNTLDVGARVSVLSRKHWEMEYEVADAGGERLVSGRTVQLMYDYGKGATRSVPADVRDAILAREGELPRRRGG